MTPSEITRLINTAHRHAKRKRRAKRWGRLAREIVFNGILLLGAFLSAFPFYWMFILATQNTNQIFSWPPQFTPGESLMTNYQTMLSIIPFWRNFANSLFVGITHTALALLFCSMGGYAFAMYRFPGRDWLFALLLATMMVPWIAGIVPWFILISKWLQWINRYEALIIPGAASAFGIFWMRQYVQESIPSELLDAARIDGCPEFLIFFRIVAPLLMPAFAALGIMIFINNWNAFLGPLLVMQDKSMYTLPVALALLRQDPRRGFDAGVLMLGTAMATLPMLIVFLAATRRFMAGLTLGALKG
ncbi:MULTISPECIES: carbohydrate ABC transporter permease [Caldilinea]|jgi:ABC-type glycerol-3-phosphate transport system permease component|uniref:L-arabinose ABC transporter permease protein n=1 Tax=Caldilinea aerophila (strain DSM 14535 / JCM 11387 / NBRC 104270 / STL-6-O1) TaxID=926550 RepID=I0I1X9_CALAS|nr:MULTISPECIES: carbohydrate ABC transporter permease [Caldilinea]BAL99266.1 L-arabinose ABC transporter permease protein [Caldilinea aerophila DSM 14535 = NBRC 104270]GIV74140.1 MAG: sugar ABC transporter ATP-binding protein [Caldilinea sp.]